MNIVKSTNVSDAGEIELLLVSELNNWSKQFTIISLAHISRVQRSLMISLHWIVWGAFVSRCDRNVSTRDWLIFVQGGQRRDVAGGFDREPDLGFAFKREDCCFGSDAGRIGHVQVWHATGEGRIPLFSQLSGGPIFGVL